MSTSTPRYPITVQLSGTDGNAMMLIGRVSREIRKHAGAEAAAEFTRTAMGCGSYDELLTFIQETVQAA